MLAKKTSKDLVAASSRPMVLSILTGGENYGYEILKQVRSLSGGQVQWSDGMLYPVLHRLERKGLIEGRWVLTDAGRRRKYYRLTSKGKGQLASDKESWRAVHGTLELLWGAAVFDLDKAVSDWRQRVERTSSLSPREVDELEDHLRARVDLEMELDQALTRERAFGMSREGLGKPATMSREFAKAGMPRWRRLLAVGWAMYGVSFFLPPAGEGRGFVRSTADLIWESIKIQDVAGLALFTLINAPMFLTLVSLRSTRPQGVRWLGGILATMAVGVACLGIGPWSPGMGTGYWVYAASLTCAAAAMWMRVGRWASPKPLATIERQRG